MVKQDKSTEEEHHFFAAWSTMKELFSIFQCLKAELLALYIFYLFIVKLIKKLYFQTLECCESCNTTHIHIKRTY